MDILIFTFLLGAATTLIIVFIAGWLRYRQRHRQYNPKKPEEAWYWFNMHDERQ